MTHLTRSSEDTKTGRECAVSSIEFQKQQQQRMTSCFLRLATTCLFTSMFLVAAEENCTSKEMKAKAPNIFRVVHAVSPGFIISNISLIKRHSFYMCEFGEGFGFNGSHWWVSNGCAGTFVLTECHLRGNN